MKNLASIPMMVLLVASSVAGEVRGEEGSFAGWPQTWVDTYQRFEAFMGERERFSQPSGLSFTPAGRVEMNLERAKSLSDRDRRVSVTYFHNGKTILERNSLTNDMLPLQAFPPGRYAACVTVWVVTGYQYVMPIVWFESSSDGSAGREGVVIKETVVPSKKAEDFWPNERLMLYLDFHSFPDVWRMEVEQRNVKAKPAVKVRVTNGGTLKRESLGPELDRLLRWRVYHNGLRIDPTAKSGEAELPMQTEPGNYLAFVGVEGPNGFMPVSNEVQFPLFPAEGGKFAVLPPASPTRVPLFLTKILDASQLAAALDPDRDGKRYANLRLKRYGFDESLAEKERELLMLWARWFPLVDNYEPKKNTVWALDEP